jgi:hypothetical protein
VVDPRLGDDLAARSLFAHGQGIAAFAPVTNTRKPLRPDVFGPENPSRFRFPL